MKTIRFFALKEDLLSILDAVEMDFEIVYSPFGNFLESDPFDNEFAHARLIPNLGKAMGSQASTCEAFLLSAKGSSINREKFLSESGERRVAVDQRMNPHSVVLRPCGLWDANTVISGTIGTVTDSDEANRIIRLFEKTIKKSFKKIKAFYVGPEAYQMLLKGQRLACAAVESPPEFDLQI